MIRNNFLILFILFVNHRIVACSCLETPPLAEAYKNSAFVITGKVISKKEADHQAIYKVRVLRRYKGRLFSDTVIVKSGLSSAECGYTFVPGKTYIIYGLGAGEGEKPEKNTFYTNICTRTALYKKSEATKLNRMRRG